MSITYSIEIDNSKFENLQEGINKITETVYEAGRKLIEQMIEEMDKTILKERDKSRYRCKGKRKTSMKMRLGVLEYERNIYYDREEQKYVYLLDESSETKTIGLVNEEITSIIEKQICTQSYRETSRSISETTGLDISHQGVWNIVQELGKRRIEKNHEMTKLNKNEMIKGKVETEILYEEADGNWLRLQGHDRKKYGSSREMKIMIAYDGVKYHAQKNNTYRKELDNKVAYASFESVKNFNMHKDAVIAGKFNMDGVVLKVKNGDGAQWIQKDVDCRTISVLDKFHRNKKIKECIHNSEMIKTLNLLMNEEKFDEMIECIEAYINSTEDEKEISGANELLRYYTENKEALSSYFERGITIPPTREPGVIHHARLGSMESNVFTLIGNRMKGRRACWSINGGNNLAAILCAKYTSSLDRLFPECDLVNCAEDSKEPLSVARCASYEGKGYEFKCNISIPSNMKWLKNISRFKNILDFKL